jgi:hypothetical protein
MRNWVRVTGLGVVLGMIVLGAAAVALRWVFLVPIFQSPDEPHHLDYALEVHRHGGLFRGSGAPKAPPGAVAEGAVHPYTNYLAKRTNTRETVFNPPCKMPPEYGSQAFYSALDRDVPDLSGASPSGIPVYMSAYPFGYYLLLAGWVGILRQLSDSLVFLFFGARILSVLLLTLTLVLTYAGARELHLRRGLALLLTAIIGLFPLTSFVASYVQPDNLSFTLVSLCLYLALVSRRRFGERWPFVVLAFALAALAVTKSQYFVCVLMSVLAMFVAEVLYRRVPVSRWLPGLVILILPAALLWGGHLWTVQDVPWFFHQDGESPGPIGERVVRLKLALLDLYAGSAHDSFYGVFGWMDTPLVIGRPTVDLLVKFTIQAGTLLVLILTLTRLEKVLSRLVVLARRGRRRQALRLALSNPVLNSYFLFTLLMILLRVFTDVLGEPTSGTQGRYWLPFLLPMVVCAMVYAPQALTLRRSRQIVSAALGGGLLLYAVVGNYYAQRTLRERFYLTVNKGPVRETPLALVPVATHQMTWSSGAGEGCGTDSYLVFALKKPEYVSGVRLKCVLTNSTWNPTALRVYWRERGKTDFTETERMAVIRMPPSPAEFTFTIGINARLDELRINPELQPCHFEIHELVLLQKPESQRAPAGP